MKKKIQNLNVLMRLFFSKKNLSPNIFNKLFDIITDISTMITIILFFLKVVLVNENWISLFSIILNVIFVALLIRVSWKFLGYHDSFNKEKELSLKEGFKQSAEIFDSINFAKLYEKIFLSFLTIVLLFLNKEELTKSISSKEYWWTFLTAIFLILNIIFLLLAKHMDLIKNYIIKYWTYSLLSTNLLLIIVCTGIFPIYNYTYKAYELYYYYFGFLILFVFVFIIQILLSHSPSIISERKSNHHNEKRKYK